MKICIVARQLTDDYSGCFEFDQAYALAEASNDVCLISLDLRSIRRKRPLGVSRIRDKGMEIIKISIPLGAINKKFFHNTAIKKFTKVFREKITKDGDFDIVHAHFLDNAYITAKTLDNTDSAAKFFVTEHSNITKLDNGSDYFRKTVNEGYGRADGFITVSKSLASAIYDEYGFESIVINNVVDTSLFRMKKAPAAGGEKVFVSVGNLTANKRMGLLARCFSKAFECDPQYKLYICGAGPEKENIENEIEKAGNADNIHMLGFQSRRNIAELFSRASAFVLLSEAETFGVVFIEAMAAGLPVISTRSGGPDEFMTEETGIFTDDAEDEIVRNLKYMAEHACDYNSEKIAEYAVSRFSPEVIAAQLCELYARSMQTGNQTAEQTGSSQKSE